LTNSKREALTMLQQGKTLQQIATLPTRQRQLEVATIRGYIGDCADNGLDVCWSTPSLLLEPGIEHAVRTAVKGLRQSPQHGQPDPLAFDFRMRGLLDVVNDVMNAGGRQVGFGDIKQVLARMRSEERARPAGGSKSK
jgi:hypothetical protein